MIIKANIVINSEMINLEEDLSLCIKNFSTTGRILEIGQRNSIKLFDKNIELNTEETKYVIDVEDNISVLKISDIKYSDKATIKRLMILINNILKILT